MNKLKSFTASLLLATTPTMSAYPQQAVRHRSFLVQKVNQEQQIGKDYVLSYDDILRLLDEIESGELKKKCTLEVRMVPIYLYPER